MQGVTFTYDGVSRVITRQEAEGLSNFNIGTSLAAKNIGKIESVSSPGGYAEHYVYDSKGRLQELRTTIDAVDYTVSRTYSSTNGLLETLTYPTSTSAVPSSRFAVKYEYANDILQRVRDLNTPTTVYWEQDASDGYGNATDVLLGNTLHTYSTYDPVNGELATRTSGSTSQVQNLGYQWDKNGNLTQRQDSNLSLTEHFYYDSHYRLDHSTLNGTQNLAMTYDSVGNIQTKTGVGTYAYDTTRKHAVVTAGTHSYGYDANGNMITRDGSGITYTSYNLPSLVNSGSNSAQFFYGASRDRYKQLVAVAAGGSLPAGMETTLYVSGVFEKVSKASGVTEYKHYITAGGDPVAIRTLRSSGVNDTRYLYKDHLGSADVVTDESGTVVSRLSYDAYGARRGSATWSGAPGTSEWNAVAAVTHRGFTYQEHADDVGLIHMNGRMYDPLIGRFTSADPVVPDSLGAQAANRYAYVGNNPLSLTDRSGYDPDGGSVTVTGHNGSGGGGGGGGGGGAGLSIDSPGSAARNAAAEAQANANTLHAPLTAQPVQPRRDGGHWVDYKSQFFDPDDADIGLVARRSSRVSDTIYSNLLTGIGDSAGMGWYICALDGGCSYSQWAKQSAIIVANVIPVVRLGTVVTDVARGGLATARTLGRAGEAAVGIARNTQRIASASGTAAFRIPDILNSASKVIGEVKNVGSLSYTNQLRDYAAYARANPGWTFDLYVRPTTQLSGPLQQAIANGDIVLRFIP